ncbi:MAG: type II toxin-antitoxin system RelB/DinJ family antitoxin [Peptococcaceae bacterium]|nr:type II toxin-antitoxin system RelB/DinJ family antitoxin [Peptococcaceae bacterium]
MSITNINIRTDSEIKTRAQEIFAMLGLDMTTAINLFLRQTVRMNDIPFVLSTRKAKPEEAQEIPKENVGPLFEYGRGCMKGKMWMADDFDAPLEDFKEYME